MLSGRWVVPSIRGVLPPRHSFTATVVGSRIYVIGGWSRGFVNGEVLDRFFRDVWYLETHLPMSNEEEEEGPLQMEWVRVTTSGDFSPRSRHTAVLLDDHRILVFGGGQVWSRDVAACPPLTFIFDTTTSEWSEIHPEGEDTPNGREGHGAVMLRGGRMLIFGGFDGTANFNDVWLLHTANHAFRWEKVECRGSFVPPEFGYFSISLIHETVYIYGGSSWRDASAVVSPDLLALNTRTWEWRKIFALQGPTPRFSHASCVAGDMLLISGGWGWDSRGAALFHADAFTYHSVTNKWSTLSEWSAVPENCTREKGNYAPPGPMFAHAIVTIGKYVIVCGGHDGECPRNDVHCYRIEGPIPRPPCIQPLPSTLLQNMGEIFESGNQSDVCLVVGDVRFPVHRAILAARCDRFNSRFRSHWKDSGDDEIRITNRKPWVIERILRFIYTDSLSPLTPEEALELLPASDEYLLTRMRRWCECILSENMDPENAATLLFLASRHNAHALYDFALHFIARMFDEVRHTTAYAALPEDLRQETFNYRRVQLRKRAIVSSESKMAKQKAEE